MHYPPLFARIVLLAAFFLGMPVVPAVAGQHASVAGAASAAKTPHAGTELNGTPWLLLGGAGFGLAFFWFVRRSRKSSTPLDKPRRIVPAQRNPHAAGADSAEAAKYWIPLDQDTTVTVDELSSVEEEADVFLLLGRMDMAIGVLRHHVEANDDAPAHVWIRLLDILHSEGLRQEFEKLAGEISGRFNVALPTWEDANIRSSELTGLERFPHLFARITACWSSPECLDYLRGLLQDNRNGERAGFHVEAFRDILTLIGVLEYRQKMATMQAMVA
ncbi:MAG: hypothetical protein PHZ14_04410 [Sulfuricella sp.]|nr:hypothetical protein [Sulfuricella sp.]